MTELHEKREKVANLVKTNVKSDANPNGLLVQQEKEYLNCLEVQHQAFEMLLRKDDQHWTDKVAKSKTKSDKLKGKMEACAEKCQKKLQDIL